MAIASYKPKKLQGVKKYFSKIFIFFILFFHDLFH